MFYWDPDPNLFIIPILNWPIKWYSVFFAMGFAIGFPIFEGILLRFFQRNGQGDICELKALARKITDKITLYTIVATIIGARLGHFIFYEKPGDYLHDPLELFRTWNGGLASHGAALAIIVAMILFARFARKTDPGLTWVRLLDLICVPVALAGAFIRMGNFINQEILGTPANLPWAVVFGHPADGSEPMMRHPVQLYEAFFYLAVFFLLWRLTFRPKFFLKEGKLIGLFLLLVFGFRFLIEYLKLEQSRLFSSPAELTMGQWLSIPLVLLGLAFLWKGQSLDPNQEGEMIMKFNLIVEE